MSAAPSDVGSSAGGNSALVLAQRFLTLSQEYNNRPVVVRRGTLPSLMKLLANRSWEVRHTAAKTLELLAEHPQNPEFMCREKGLVQSLYDAFQESDISDPELHATLARVFDHLKQALGGDAAGSQDDERMDDGGLATGESIRTVKNRPTRVKQGATTSRRVVLSVAGLSQPEVASGIEDLLQTTRGIVSYTVDPGSALVSLFTSLSTDTILTVLNGHTTVDCRVVSEEEFAAVAPPPSSSRGGVAMPSYGGQYRRGGGGILGAATSSSARHGDPMAAFRHSLVIHGADSNSLASRIAREKEDEKRRQMESQRTSVSSFLSKLAKSWW